MSNHRFWWIGLAAVMALALLGSASSGVAQQAPGTPPGETIPYAGRLTDAAGGDVADGKYDLLFELYAAETGGVTLWSETQAGVPVSGGAFGVVLGSSHPLSKEMLDHGGWLQVSVRGPAEAAFTALEPRQRFGDVLNGQSPDLLPGVCIHDHFNEWWEGSSSQAGLIADNRTGTGDGIRGYANRAAANYAGVYGVNVAAGPGVYGRSDGGGPGVAGYSTGRGVYGSGADGVVGESATHNMSGVYGNHTGAGSVLGYGVTGRAGNNFGVFAWGNDESLYDAKGDLLLQGSYGEIFANGGWMDLYSNGHVIVDLDNDNNDSGAFFRILSGTDGILWTISETSGMVTSDKQATVVDTASQGQRLMYAVEGTGVWLEDLGTAALGANGEITLPFDPIYAEAADLRKDYQVFVTPLGEQPVLLYVSAKTSTGFTVRGVTLDGKPAACQFDYRVVAPRLGYSGLRTESYAPDQALGKGQP